ncbi:MAG: hypothetical protein CMA60_00325 [Euryarchaeota archaeon]|nr:hypothetical protein [Euryarchaeota archaeon]
MAHNKKVKQELVKYLGRHGEKNTRQIHRYLHKRLRNCPSTTEIGTLLRNKKFYRAGYINEVKNGKRVRVQIWGLKKD